MRIDIFMMHQRWMLLLLWLSSLMHNMEHAITAAAFTTPLSRHVLRPFGVSKQETGDFPSRITRMAAANDDIEEEEWHPRDPAYTTPQLLSGLWFLIAEGSSMVKGETSTVLFPQMQTDEYLNNPRYLNLLTAHLDSCKDVCDHFGITTTLVPYLDKKTGKVSGFTVKSYRDPNKDPDAPPEFDYDPYWDDGSDWNYEGVDELAEAEEAMERGEASTSPSEKKKHVYPEIVNKIPQDDDEIIDITKTWVGKLMADMGICPFTSNAELAGLPLGDVFYCVDRCTSMEDMYARYWREVVRIEQNDERDVSTTLLIAPEFLIDNIELFESFTNTLTQPLAALELENLIQLVFFHPDWSFRDGGARSGGGEAAANYARRSPWPMINILRTKQVRAAQRGIPTGLVYKQNEKTLSTIGVEKLETMLRLRDWSEIADFKVNRRDLEALRVAQDFQESGTVSEADTSLEYDATPAANKVDPRQVEQGDMLNVMKQALEKRVGKTEESKTITPLSGPETSATLMASDILLQELERLVESGSSSTTQESPISSPPEMEPTTKESEAQKSKVVTEDDDAEDDAEDVDAAAKATKEREQRLAVARQALMDDLSGAENTSPSETGRGSEELDVLFGGGGIMGKKDDDDEENFSAGMNPNSFY